MWLFAVIAVALAALVSPFMSSRANDERVITASQARVLAEGISVYRGAVIDWAHAHPGSNGLVDEAAVPGPAWWRRDPSIRAAVTGQVIAVYLTGSPVPGVLDEMVRLSDGSIWVGTANRASGTLHSPSMGDTGIEVPPQVPDQAPVWLAQRS